MSRMGNCACGAGNGRGELRRGASPVADCDEGQRVGRSEGSVAMEMARREARARGEGDVSGLDVPL